MAEDLQRISRFVAALAWRERLLILARVAVRAALLVSVLVGLAIVAAQLRWDRSAAAMVVIGLGGVGTWIVVALPFLLAWRPAGDAMRQARLVESLAPELRGRLLTSVERVDGPVGRESPAMLGLVARKAATVVGGVAPRTVHPGGQVARLAALTGAVYALALVLWAVFPGVPSAVVAWWVAGTSAQAAISGHDLAVEEDFARVGDLVLRYTYPDYTGLEPKRIPNSTGDVRGPPGTVVDVLARSADPVEAAGLVAYDERLDASLGEDARAVEARFSIRAEAGAYHLLLYRGGESIRSRDFAIEPEEDLPPEVMLDAESDVIEVSVNDFFPAVWRARDDYGVKKVGLSVSGRDVDKVVYRQTERRAEVFGELDLSPADLGLAPGDRAELVVEAWDNDTFSGSKVGRSRPIEIIVLGAQGQDRMAAERQEELKKLMLGILARFLTEPWPAADTSGGLAAWGEVVAARYDPLYRAIDRLWQGLRRDSADAEVVNQVAESAQNLIRYTQVAFTPGSEEVPSDAAFGVTAELRDEVIVDLEDAILALHRMLANRALNEAIRLSEDFEVTADILEELLAEDDPDPQELLSRLDQLERKLAQLAEATSKLADNALEEYLEMRQGELQKLLDEIRQALMEGDLEEAKALMDRLAQQIRDMTEGLQENLRQRQQQSQQIGQEVDSLIEKLEQMEEDQRALQSEVQALREQDDQGASEEAAKLWERIEQETRKVQELGRDYAIGLDSAERRFYERERTKAALDDGTGLLDAVVARDLRGSKKKVVEVAHLWNVTYKAAVSEQTRRNGRLAGPQPQEVAQIRRRVDEIQRMLDRLEDASRQVDPEIREAAQELRGRQQDLENQISEAQEDAKRIAQQYPVRPDGLEEALEEGAERMDQASDDLGQGRPMEAEGSQGVAAERLGDARRALEQAQQQAQSEAQQSQGSRGGDPGQEGSDSRDSNGDRNTKMPRDMEIPTREEFRTPEEYRRALLEGMEGEVPEEYRALKKRYYEELVHQ